MEPLLELVQNEEYLLARFDSAFTLFGAFGGPMAKPPAGE